MKDHKIKLWYNSGLVQKSIAARFWQTDNQIQHTFPDIYHIVAIIFYYQFKNDSKK